MQFVQHAEIVRMIKCNIAFDISQTMRYVFHIMLTVFCHFPNLCKASMFG